MIEFNATFLVAMLSFVVFIFIMNAIYYRPILNIIKKREDYISSNLDKAKQLEQKAQNLQKEYDEKLQHAKIETRNQSLLEINRAQKESFEQIQQAKENSKLIIQSKKDELSEQKSQLQSTLNQGIVKELSEIITHKIINRNN